MKRVLLDTNIYGEMVQDMEVDTVVDLIIRKRYFIIYGSSIVRKELRDTSKNELLDGSKNLRISLIGLYRKLTENHELEITREMIEIAENYYKAYREFGGSKSKESIIDDFVIVACASVKNLDIVVSEDDSSMLRENAIRAYQLVNRIIKKETPSFIGYEEFKAQLKSGGS